MEYNSVFTKVHISARIYRYLLVILLMVPGTSHSCEMNLLRITMAVWCRLVSVDDTSQTCITLASTYIHPWCRHLTFPWHTSLSGEHI